MIEKYDYIKFYIEVFELDLMFYLFDIIENKLLYLYFDMFFF